MEIETFEIYDIARFRDMKIQLDIELDYKRLQKSNSDEYFNIHINESEKNSRKNN
jgi:hypothetical protein